jgi:thymidine kinase
MAIALNQKVNLAKEVLIQDLQGKSTLVHIHSQECFFQNEVGIRMLWVLAESESIQAAYNTLLEEYEVEPQQLQQDLLNYIEKLEKYKLIEVIAS